MLDLLRKGPLNTRELTVQFPGYSRFAVMQHLTVLAAGRLVVRRRQGRERLNYLNPVPIQQIHQRWVSRYEGPWMEALIALKEEAEAGDRGARKQRAQAA
jgi:DNA-binding transcriptional ArsR family regulator